MSMADLKSVAELALLLEHASNRCYILFAVRLSGYAISAAFALEMIWFPVTGARGRSILKNCRSKRHSIGRKRVFADGRLLLVYPNEQTFVVSDSMSQTGHSGRIQRRSSAG
jgi:hypothetical protein